MRVRKNCIRKILSVDGLTAAIKKKRGNLTRIAKGFRVSRAAVHKYINERPELKQLLEEERTAFVDEAEHKLIEAVDAGEEWAIRLVLKCQARDRGWVERQEIDLRGPDGGPIQIQAMSDEQLEAAIENRARRIAAIADGDGSAPGAEIVS